jgi:DNA polymerase III delta subunit
LPKDNHPDNKAPSGEQSKIEEWIIKYRNEIPDDHILIFVSYKPDKRTKGAKFFLEQATVKEFPLLNEKQLANKAQDLLTTYINGVTAQQLVAYIGINGGVGTLTHECEKLLHYCQAKDITTITIDIITQVCTATTESDAFALLDSLFLDTAKSLSLIEEEEKNAVEPLEFLGRLFWGMKLMLGMVDAYDRGIISATDIAKEIGMHHFPIMKRLKDYKTYKAKIETIKSCYGELLQLNYDLITGGLPVEGFWLEVKRIVQLS